MAGDPATEEGGVVKKILALLFYLATTGYVLHNSIEAYAGSPSYRWITQDEVILWRSLDDDRPVTATLDRQTGKWAITPNDAADAWQTILEQVAQNYSKDLDLKRITNEQLWSFVLTKLRNQFSTGVPWAQPRRPSVQVYLLPSPNELRVAFISESNGAPKRTLVTFTLDQNGVWTKSANIDLSQLLGVKDDPNELSSVFRLPYVEPSANVSQQWKTVWNRWIRDFLRDSPVSHFMYRDNQRQLRWLWRERLQPGTELPAAYPRLPSSPAQIAESTLPTLAPATQPPTSQYPFLNLILIIVIVSAFLAAYFFGRLWLTLISRVLRTLAGVRQPLGRVLASLFRRLAGFLDGSGARHQLINEEVLNAVHELAVASCQKRLGSDDAMSHLLVAAFELARQQYIAAAASKELLGSERSLRASIIDEYRNNELGIAVEDTLRIKRWIELGRAAEPGIAQVSTLLIPPDVEKQLTDKRPITEWQETDWLTEWPRLIAAFASSLAAGKKECVELQAQMAQQLAANVNAIAEQDLKLTALWQAEVARLQEETRTMQQAHKTAKDELRSTHQKELANVLENSRNQFRAELNSAQAATTYLQNKMNELEYVKRLSRGLRQWMQGYYEKRANDSAETRGVAIIAALLNFSLGQLCFSILDEAPALTKVVANNIFRFTTMFDQNNGRKSEFTQSLQLLNRIAPNVEHAISELQDADLGGNTLDNPLFKALLYWLKIDTGRNLSPFFIDVDTTKKTLVLVNVS